MAKTTYLIPCWSTDEYALKLKEQLIQQGVDPGLIWFTKEKKSRAWVLNKYIKDITTEYIGLCDDDVIISDNAVSVLEDLMDKYSQIGMALAPTFQQKELSKPIPKLKLSTPDENAIENTSAKMWSFNFTLLRKSCNVIFDEDFFGSQLIDWDVGLDLLNKGYMSVIDHRCAVAHKQTMYDSKSLTYHAVVARSRHIFMEKWKDIQNWKGVEEFNKSNNNAIPTLEEITHASEKWLMNYVSKYDQAGLINCWFAPRFGTEEAINNFLKDFHTNYVGKNNQIFNPYVHDMMKIPTFK
jgi:hypothetical protein